VLAVSWCALGAAYGCGETPKGPSAASAGAAGTAVSSGGSAAQTAGQAGSSVTASGTASGGAAQSAGSGNGGSGNGGAPASAGSAGGPGNAGTAGADMGSTEPLQIYWVDVEGGAATLLIAPNGEVVVVDAGFPGSRDPERIAKVLKDEVKADHIDHMICTHYHSDHVGGVSTLGGLLPITHFYDHGATVQPGNDYNSYVSFAGNKRVLTKAGDKLTLGDVVLTFVTGAGKVIDPPLPGSKANPTCPATSTPNMDGGAENGQSLGFIARFGNFSFLDLGDLTWDIEQVLMCPTNRIGTVDLFQVSHHGQDFSNSPQLVHAISPVVAVMNNGASKGGGTGTFETLKSSPGIQDIWALHQVTANDAAHNAEAALTANLAGGQDAANYIKAVVAPNGSYTLTNGRTGMSKTYAARLP
jgi:competence protein ComEC